MGARGEHAAQRLERAVAAYLERIGGLPPELLAREPAPGEWSVLELSAHAAEIYGYWAGQIARVRPHPGQPFGRTMADPARIQFVADHKGDAIRDLAAMIRHGANQAASELRAFADDEWATVTGLHSARGAMHMDAIADLFLAGHAEEHLHQLEATLAALQPEESSAASAPKAG